MDFYRQRSREVVHPRTNASSSGIHPGSRRPLSLYAARVRLVMSEALRWKYWAEKNETMKKNLHNDEIQIPETINEFLLIFKLV